MVIVACMRESGTLDTFLTNQSIILRLLIIQRVITAEGLTLNASVAVEKTLFAASCFVAFVSAQILRKRKLNNIRLCEAGT